MDSIAIHIPATPEITALVKELLKLPGVKVEMVADDDGYLTLAEAAKEARMNYHSFRRLVVDRRLIKYSRPGGEKSDIRIKRSDLRAYLDNPKRPKSRGRKARGVSVI